MLIVQLKWNKVGWNMEKMSEEALRAFWEFWPNVMLNHPVFEEWKPSSAYLDQKVKMSLDQAYTLQQHGVQIEIEGLLGTMLTKMQDRGAWGYDDGVMPHNLKEGSAVQITIPDMALMKVDEVDWIEDACTQALQEKLDNGWRILAVCPPNAQRRPDYILGRRKRLDP